MAKLDPPRIHVGPLSGRVYCITHGKIIEPATADRGELLEASVKYDVTDQVDAIAAERYGIDPERERMGQ